MEKTGVKSYKSSDELNIQQEIINCFKECPIPQDQLMENLGLFLNSKNFSRMLFMHHIYQQIIDVPGVVFEFGTRWGNNLSLFSIFRSMYEPFNRHRKLIGFDTFEGFPSVHSKDGQSDLMKAGNVACTPGYENFLDRVMDLQEKQNPLAHIKKYEIRKGDATKSLVSYLEQNPETIVALAYFDFDIYEPTKVCLDLIKNRVVKGSVLAFDELNDHDSPGETLAVMEVFGLQNIRLKRLATTSRTSFFVVE